MAGLAETGWLRFETDRAISVWARAARAAAEAALQDPQQRRKWLKCEGTWFVGVDALDNDSRGAVAGVPLHGAAVDAAQSLFGPLPFHRAQLSGIFPGYPRPRDGEGEAAFRYRLRRDAAHVDGIRIEGRARKIRELHGYILGLPLTVQYPGQSPLVVWEGSVGVMRARLLRALRDVPRAGWGQVDITSPYKVARREIFETCRRVEVVAQPGEAVLLHRLCLHGIAPWTAAAGSGRLMAYFRPEMPGSVADWLGVVSA
ncbi:MAG: hypothetical protein CSA70_01940 [Rhodobacterales bacterium]|nr:MAG: hypothetical protein CSA70_01940 [Rhodobacterales bacterium]